MFCSVFKAAATFKAAYLVDQNFGLPQNISVWLVFKEWKSSMLYDMLQISCMLPLKGDKTDTFRKTFATYDSTFYGWVL